MHRLLQAGAIFFIVIGLLVAILSMLLPVVLAFGLGVGQGLALVFGGLLLLALAQLINAVERVAMAVEADGRMSIPTGINEGGLQPLATPPSAQQQVAQQQKPQPEQKPAAQQQQAAQQPEKEPAARQQAAAQQPKPEEPTLYVVGERTIRGCPVRILSNGTIEAELDEGWLRFENMEHLNEYLDALEELRHQGMI